MGQELSIIKVAKDSLGKFKTFFASPVHLLQRVYDYIEWCENNPKYRTEQISKPDRGIMLESGEYIPPEHLIEVPITRVPTKEGFAIFAGCSSKYLHDFRSDIKTSKKADPDGAWMNVLDMLNDIVFVKNYEAAAAGLANPMLTARYLRLAENVETKAEVKTTKEIFKLGDIEIEL